MSFPSNRVTLSVLTLQEPEPSVKDKRLCEARPGRCQAEGPRTRPL